ncbi:MAG: hypothetical protein ACRDPA_28790 [Solirubrobacteraceae bacterium]
MTELPNGWERARLDDVATVSGGIQKQPSRTPRRHTAPFLRVANVGSGTLNLDDVHEIEISPDELERYQLRPGDLLVVEGNGSASQIGRAARWRGEIPNCVHQNHLMRVRPDPAISSRFLEYLWMSPAVCEDVQARAASTSGLFVLTTRKISTVELVVAPLAEQERIVAAIEEAFSKLDAGEAGLRAVRQLLKRMRDAVLAAAVTGRLVPQDPTDRPVAKVLADIGCDSLSPDEADVGIPSGWELVELASVLASPLSNGRSVRSREGGFPVLRLTALRNGRIDLDERKEGEWVAADAIPYLVEMGDFLVSRGNGSLCLVGRGGLVDVHPDPVAYPDTLIRVRVRGPLVHRPFLAMIWNSRVVREQLEAQARTTAGIYKVNQSMLAAVRLPLPPTQEQCRIVAEVERQLSYLDACEQVVDAESARSAALRRSVLKAAFEGQLVPQDPSDEPAAVLLERIRTNRAAAPKRARRPSRTA